MAVVVEDVGVVVDVEDIRLPVMGSTNGGAVIGGGAYARGLTEVVGRRFRRRHKRVVLYD